MGNKSTCNGKLKYMLWETKVNVMGNKSTCYGKQKLMWKKKTFKGNKSTCYGKQKFMWKQKKHVMGGKNSCGNKK